MLQIQLDEEQIKKLLLEKIEEKVEAAGKELVFWDSGELKRRTCLSWNTIQEHFLSDPYFPKTKVGTKWIFPAKETEQYLMNWYKKQKGAR